MQFFFKHFYAWVDHIVKAELKNYVPTSADRCFWNIFFMFYSYIVLYLLKTMHSNAYFFGPCTITTRLQTNGSTNYFHLLKNNALKCILFGLLRNFYHPWKHQLISQVAVTKTDM